MKDLLNGLSDHYNWLHIYTTYVIYEYKRYLALYAKYDMFTVAPEAIEQCWMYHVLNMEHYYNYCKKHFNKIIAYKPLNISFEMRNEYLDKNKMIYFQEYGLPKYELVWIYNIMEKIYYDKQKIITIMLQDKYYKITPTENDTIYTLKKSISVRNNIELCKISLFLDGLPTFNISQLYRKYNCKELKDSGFSKEYPLHDKFLLLDILYYGYKNIIVQNF